MRQLCLNLPINLKKSKNSSQQSLKKNQVVFLPLLIIRTKKSHLLAILFLVQNKMKILIINKVQQVVVCYQEQQQVRDHPTSLHSLVTPRHLMLKTKRKRSKLHLLSLEILIKLILLLRRNPHCLPSLQPSPLKQVIAKITLS